MDERIAVKATPRFFSKDFPGEEPMGLELYKNWASGSKADKLNLFLFKSHGRGRVRVQMTVEAAKTLAAQMTRYAEQIEAAQREAEPSACIAGNPTVEGKPCGDPDCVCAR